jgi:hypothetical protein
MDKPKESGKPKYCKSMSVIDYMSYIIHKGTTFGSFMVPKIYWRSLPLKIVMASVDNKLSH